MPESRSELVKDFYGNRIRVRVCGIHISNNRILLINHALEGEGSNFWSPPGGGIDLGESALNALKREFVEETGLLVEVGEMLFINEYIEQPLHAVELFFKIISVEGNLVKGFDPEFSEETQIIQNLRYMAITELLEIPADARHGVFNHISSLDDLFTIKGLVSFQ